MMAKKTPKAPTKTQLKKIWAGLDEERDLLLAQVKGLDEDTLAGGLGADRLGSALQQVQVAVRVDHQP
jgi:hypothetical protein